MARGNRRTGNGKALRVVCCILAEVLLLVGSGVLGWFLHKWTKGEAPEEKGTEGGMVITAPVEGDISLTSAPLPIGEYEAYDVSPAAESARQVSATFKDEYGAPLAEADAAQVKLEWSLEWTTDILWASGKTVTEYVTLSVGEDTHTATLSCLQPFGTQIVLKAAVKGDESVSGTATVDYRQKYENWVVYVTFPNNCAGFSFGDGPVDHVSNFKAINFPDEFEELSWESRGKIEFKIVGNDVYTLPLSYTVGTAETMCSGTSIEKITEAGGYPRRAFSGLIDAGYDEQSHTWTSVKLEEMLGMSYGNAGAGFTLRNYRAALCDIATVSGLGFAAVYKFSDVKVNGEPLDEKFEFSLNFNGSSLHSPLDAVELTPGNIEL